LVLPKGQGCYIELFWLEPAVLYRVYAGAMDGLTRSHLAVRTQVNLETIRFYEGKGLLPIAPRTASGYPKFSESNVEGFAFVKRSKLSGFLGGNS
jgi:hypothetical protein